MFSTKNISVFGYKVVKHLTSWPLNELVKLTMLWTIGPRYLSLAMPQLSHFYAYYDSTRRYVKLLAGTQRVSECVWWEGWGGGGGGGIRHFHQKSRFLFKQPENEF